MKPKTDIRSLALIGARAELAKLKELVTEMEETVRLLQQAAASERKPARRRKVTRRKHSAAFKDKIVGLAKAEGSSTIAARYHLSPSLVYTWLKKAK